MPLISKAITSLLYAMDEQVANNFIYFPLYPVLGESSGAPFESVFSASPLTQEQKAYQRVSFLDGRLDALDLSDPEDTYAFLKQFDYDKKARESLFLKRVSRPDLPDENKAVVIRYLLESSTDYAIIKKSGAWVVQALEGKWVSKATGQILIELACKKLSRQSTEWFRLALFLIKDPYIPRQNKITLAQSIINDCEDEGIVCHAQAIYKALKD